VIEDAAQSIGADYKGRRAGSMGDMGIFSFFPSKNLGGFGDGGMVVTSRPELAEKLRLLRVHGSKPKYVHKIVGGNFRLDAIQAAVLNVKLRYLDDWSAARRENAEFYNRYIGEAGIVSGGAVHPPFAAGKDTFGTYYHIYNQYTLRCPRRDELRDHLRKNGVGSEIYYPLSLHQQECFAGLGYKAGDFPESERAASEVLSIPVFPELYADQREYVARMIVEFYSND
jgi:dTDP-4-amino-4,6-dideoxygalactose transaminase